MSKSPPNQLSHEIYETPQLPDLIKNIGSMQLVVFVGAGCSMLLGCAGWKDVAHKLIEAAYENKDINHWEKERLQGNDPRKAISILKGILPPEKYYGTIRESLNVDPEKAKKYPIYDELIKLRGIYVTTNIDTHFDEKFEDARIFCDPPTFVNSNLEKNTLFKLHGSITNEDGIIFATRDYIKHYNDKNVRRFLEEIFGGNYLVLFVGYSLSEIEILDYLLFKGNPSSVQSNSAVVSSSLLLLPFNTPEVSLLKFEQTYFNQLGVVVIPYAIDKNGYNQLFAVISSWQKEINLVTPYLYNSFKIIEECSGPSDARSTSEILQLIKNDIPFRRHFFNNMKSIEWLPLLKREGYFNPSDNPEPEKAEQEGYFSIPEWIVLPYLESVSGQMHSDQNKHYISELLEIIKSVSLFKKPDGKHVDNYRTWWFFVKCLLNLPNTEIPDDIIELIPIWIDSNFSSTLAGSAISSQLLPKFLSDIGSEESLNKAEKIVLYITSVNSDNCKLYIDPYWLEETFKKHSGDIGKWLSNDVIYNLLDSIKIILGEDTKPYRSYQSLFEDPEYSLTDPLDVLTDILKKVLVSKANIHIDATKEIIQKFFEEKHLIFPKLALYIVGSCDGYTALLWDFMAIKPQYFGDDDICFTDEIKHIYMRLRQLTPEQKEILRSIIEKGPKEKDREDSERYIAFWKQQRYQALSAADPDFLEEYNRLKLITGTDAEMGPAIGHVKTSWVGPGESPLKYEDMLVMPNSDIAKHLNEFRQKSRWEGPTYEGLAQAIRELAKQHPEKFTTDLKPFLNTSYYYIYEMLRGLLECWNSKNTVKWGTVFSFLKQYMYPEHFWNDVYKLEDGSWNAGHGWVVGQAAEIIQAGTKDRAWEFEVDLLPQVQEFLLWVFLRSNTPDEESEAKSDPITYSLNTPSGKLVIALLYLSLRYARLDDENGQPTQPRWRQELREAYSQALASNTIEAYVFFGEYLPNFYYLDDAWTRKMLQKLESFEDELLWSYFMYGYLYSSHVYDDLFKLMKANYERAYGFEFAKNEVKDRLIQHLTLGYLRGNETLEDNCLFGKLIHDGNLSDLKEVVDFLWMQRSSTDSDEPNNIEIIGKVIDFWRWLYNKYSDKTSAELNREEKALFSNVSRLVVFLPQIDDENYKWLLQALPFANVNHHAYSVIEYLDRLKEKGARVESATYLGALYLAMLDSFTPDYDQKHILSIVNFLYDAGNKETADKICNIYGARGLQFLRDLYERNNA